MESSRKNQLNSSCNQRVQLEIYSKMEIEKIIVNLIVLGVISLIVFFFAITAYGILKTLFNKWVKNK